MPPSSCHYWGPYLVSPHKESGNAVPVFLNRNGKKEINMRLNAIAAPLAGALVSAAAASSAYAQYYYGPGYYPGYAYTYEPGYAYVAPAYPYAAPVYGYVYYVPPPACWNSTSDSRN